MKRQAPHPDEIALVRKLSYVPYCEAKWALGKGFKYPLALTYEEQERALDVMEELNGGSAAGMAEVFPNRASPRRLRWQFDAVIWFKDAEIATYVKLMI